jgi:hypothetical protein
MEDFNKVYPDCFKASIEKKFKEICAKVKKEKDLKSRYYVFENIIKSFEIPESELEEMLKQKESEYVEEQKKIKDEMKLAVGMTIGEEKTQTDKEKENNSSSDKESKPKIEKISPKVEKRPKKKYDELPDVTQVFDVQDLSKEE